jgi:hypothetical protein
MMFISVDLPEPRGRYRCLKEPAEPKIDPVQCFVPVFSRAVPFCNAFFRISLPFVSSSCCPSLLSFVHFFRKETLCCGIINPQNFLDETGKIPPGSFFN